MSYMQILQNIVWWPGVLQQQTVFQIAIAAGATYYFVGLPSLDSGITGIAYPWLGMGASLVAVDALTSMGGDSAAVSY